MIDNFLVGRFSGREEFRNTSAFFWLELVAGKGTPKAGQLPSAINNSTTEFHPSRQVEAQV
jgi:hypothetical protein